MPQQQINTTDPGSDRLADAFGKVNNNDTELYDHVGSTDGHPIATITASGFLSAADKSKLAGVETGATADQVWADIPDKPTMFSPSLHKTSHATEGTDALAASDIGAAARLAPAPNLMPDSGRFGGKQNPMLLGVTGAFTNPGWFTPFNGTTNASAGKFIHDNSTNGGAGGALTQPVIDLLAVLNRTSTSARYGAEFYVARYTMGTGTVAPNTTGGITRYLSGSNGARTMFGPGGLNTFAAWVRCTAGSIMFYRQPLAGLGGVVRSELNGVEQTETIVLTPADGWKHVLVLTETFAGYVAEHPFIYAESTGVWEIACPFFAAGEVNLDWRNDHAAPLLTINELIV